MAGLYLSSEELASLTAKADGHQLLQNPIAFGDDALRFVPLLPWMSKVVERAIAQDHILGCILPDIADWRLADARFYDREISAPRPMGFPDAVQTLESKVSFEYCGDLHEGKPVLDIYQNVTFVRTSAGSFAPYFSYLMHYHDFTTKVSVVFMTSPTLRHEHSTLVTPQPGGNVVHLAIAADVTVREGTLHVAALEWLGNGIIEHRVPRSEEDP